MLRQPLIILDLETTGMLAAEERITEIGLVEVDKGEFVDSWSQLVNPEKSIPPFIESLTGISDAMVRHAPTFAQLAPALFARLRGQAPHRAQRALRLRLSAQRVRARRSVL